MRSLALGLAVPLFYTLAVSLPYEVNELYDYDGFTVPRISNGDDLLDLDSPARFAVGEAQTNPHLWTGSNPLLLSESLPNPFASLASIEFAGNPSLQLAENPSPQQDPTTNPDLPWTLNPQLRQTWPAELRIVPQNGQIPAAFRCTFGKVAGVVNCKPGYKCARCQEGTTTIYYCSSPHFTGDDNRCPVRQGTIDSTDNVFEKRRQAYDGTTPPICECDS